MLWLMFGFQEEDFMLLLLVREFSLRGSFVCAKMAGNGKGKGIAEYYGNDDTVDAVVAGRAVQDVVLDAAVPCNIMPFHTMEALGLKPTWRTARLLFIPTHIDLSNAIPAGLIEDVPVDVGPVRVLSTFQILRMQVKNSYPLLLGAPYMIAMEDFSVQAAATLSLEGLVVKNGKVVRFPFSQQQRREKRRASQWHPIETHNTGDVQRDYLPRPSAGPSLVSNSSEQRRVSHGYPIDIPDIVDIEGDDLPQPSAGRTFVSNSPEQNRGSQYNPIMIPDTVDDLPQPSAGRTFVSNSPEQNMGSQYNPIMIPDTVDDLPQPSAGPTFVSNSPEQNRGSQYNLIMIPDTVDDLPQPSAGFVFNSPEQRRDSHYNPIVIPDTVDDLPLSAEKNQSTV